MTEKNEKKKQMTNRGMLLFGAMMVVAIGMMAVFIIGMLQSSMAIALGGFGGGAVILIVLMMIFVLKPKDKEGKDVNSLFKHKEIQMKDPVHEIDWRKTKDLLYEGEISSEKENCSVCKLKIKKGPFIMQCPQCLSLSHGEHFIEWLLEHAKCPVCSFEINIKK